MNEVVKCGECRQYFMHTEKDTACPFCHTEYDKTEEKTKDLPAMPVHAEQTEKKGSTKTRKESFKIWKDV